MTTCCNCGKELHESASTCPQCKAPQPNNIPESGKKQSTAILLAFFLGLFGGHRFYLGQMWFGILYLFTFGLLGVGTLIDLLNLAFMRPEVFAAKYNTGFIGQPIGVWAKLLALIFIYFPVNLVANIWRIIAALRDAT